MINTEASKEQVETLLRRHWPEFCDFLDDGQVKDAVANGDRMLSNNPGRIEGGADFDIQFALQTATEAATLITTLLRVYKDLQSTQEETRATLKKTMTERSDLIANGAVSAKRDALIEDILSDDH